jgi:predicted dehydrogenase
MTQQTVRFGLVGAGGIAQAYAQAFETCKLAKLVAVADVRLEAAKALAEQVNCPCFDSQQAMAEAVELDAVIVCTPPVSHPEISVYFLDRDINASVWPVPEKCWKLPAAPRQC